MLNAIFAIALFAPASTLMALHWFPWVDAINRPLHRLESYVLGVGAINGVAISLLILAESANQPVDARLSILLLSTCTASGGLGTLLAWTIDYIIRQRRSNQRRQRRRQIEREGQANARTFWAESAHATD